MVNPCCGQSLQTGVKLVAIINLLFTIGLIVTEVVLIYKAGIHGVEILNPEFADGRMDSDGSLDNRTELVTSEIASSDKKSAMIFQMPVLDFTISIGWILSWVVDIGFSILLYHAAVTLLGVLGLTADHWYFDPVSIKSIPKSLIWFYFRTAILVFRIIFLIIYVVAGLALLSKIPVIVQCLIRIYSLWVVNCFIKELRAEKQAAGDDEVGVYHEAKGGIDNQSFT